MAEGALHAAALLAQAQAETGLEDWGDPTLPDRFAQAVELLRAAGMDGEGEGRAAEVCLWLLESRLQLLEDHRRYPVAAEVIERPVFATGEPRSGTTLLHALLSVDPNGRALRFWEVMYPSPPPGLSGPDDPRPAKADADWREINARLPRWLLSHPYNDMLGDGLPEDERTWAFDFRVLTPTAWWRVPTGSIIAGLPSDPRAQLALHKAMLQQFQYARPKRYWVLKGFHGPRLAELFETYPDARIIWTHRDPVQSIASRICMMADLTEGLTGRPPDLKALAPAHLAAGRAGFHATLANPLIDDPRIYHVRYRDFVADPVGTIQRFYERYDMPWSGETDAAMRGYLAANKGDRYGKFRYSTEVIGENLDKLHAEFAPYRQRFGLEIEQRG